MEAQLDLNQALIAAQRAATAGRKVLLDYYGRLRQVQKKVQAGLVSEADLESERVIAEILKHDFPKIEFLGEEGAYQRQEESIAPNCWVVDPLDGTTNYVHGFPLFCISIGLQVAGELVMGLVDVPLLDRVYSAKKGQGAECNGKPLAVSQTQELGDCLLATGFIQEQPTALREQISIFSSLVYEARGIRRGGSAAYDLCLVAEGVFDAYWEPNLKPWDAAAGVLIVREAGGTVTTYQGSPYSLGDSTLIAGNHGLCQQLRNRIARP